MVEASAGYKRIFFILFSLHEKVTVNRKAFPIQKWENGKRIVSKELFNERSYSSFGRGFSLPLIPTPRLFVLSFFNPFMFLIRKIVAEE